MPQHMDSTEVKMSGFQEQGKNISAPSEETRPQWRAVEDARARNGRYFCKMITLIILSTLAGGLMVNLWYETTVGPVLCEDYDIDSALELCFKTDNPKSCEARFYKAFGNLISSQKYETPIQKEQEFASLFDWKKLKNITTEIQYSIEKKSFAETRDLLHSMYGSIIKSVDKW